MALAVSGRFSIESVITKAVDLHAGGTATLTESDLVELSLANGTGAGQVDRGYFDVGAPGTGSTTTVDVSGSLTNGFADTQAFVKIKLLWFRSLPANTVNFTLFGNAAEVPFLSVVTTTTTVTPGGIVMFYNPTGYAVTGATGDIIQIVTGAATGQVYNLIVLGTSA